LGGADRYKTAWKAKRGWGQADLPSQALIVQRPVFAARAF